MIVEKVDTLDGWYCLHTIYHLNWGAWQKNTVENKKKVVDEFLHLLADWQKIADDDNGSHYIWNVTGHKGDLGFMILRPTMANLNDAENQINKLKMIDYLNQVHSYVSVLELGGYTGTPKTEKAWAHVNQHLYPKLPDKPYICFYPMVKRRDVGANWFTLTFDERKKLMKEHAHIGRQYAGKIWQYIGGSIGFDDYEWGVTLLAEDPLEIKKIIYEMRFSEASSVYSDFPYFIVGTSLMQPDKIMALLL